jgi:hypothetical protein
MNFESAVITFGATFAGVILSFSFWFGGSYLIKWLENRKALKYMMREIQEEMQFNIAALDISTGHVQKALSGGDIPLVIPRLRHSATSYAVSSGEVRFLRSIRKQQIVGYTATVCEEYNHFVDNTERLLAILLLREDGLTWVKHRLEGFAEHISECKSLLQDYLNKLQQEKLPEGEFNKHKSNSA